MCVCVYLRCVKRGKDYYSKVFEIVLYYTVGMLAGRTDVLAVRDITVPLDRLIFKPDVIKLFTDGQKICCKLSTTLKHQYTVYYRNMKVLQAQNSQMRTE